MQDETALYGAKMMQPGLTTADNEENSLRPQHLEAVSYTHLALLPVFGQGIHPKDHLPRPMGIVQGSVGVHLVCQVGGIGHKAVHKDVYKRQGRRCPRAQCRPRGSQGSGRRCRRNRLR